MMSFLSEVSHSKKPPSLLVIAYQRPENLDKILRVAEISGIRHILISIDFPRYLNMDSMKLSEQVHKVALKYQNTPNLEVVIFRRSENVGCTPSVLSSCDWAFSQSEELIVLEDDCIPSVDFFSFCHHSLSVLRSDSDTWMACGTQLAPVNLINESWIYSKYPLTWGWCSTSTKWQEIRNSLLNSSEKLTHKNTSQLSFTERVYWNAGARRAFEGISDAWDTPLVQKMLLARKRVILPQYSLVTNIGNDSVATHTHGAAAGIAVGMGSFISPYFPPSTNSLVEIWLRKSFYRVRSRHIVSTKLTWFLDLFRLNREKITPLAESWARASVTTQN